MCSLDFPTTVVRCHVCGGKLAHLENTNPPDDWRDDVAQVQSWPETDEPARVVGWRRRELEAAGYGADAADRIAERPAIDLHRACELLERGCPESLAIEILL